MEPYLIALGSGAALLMGIVLGVFGAGGAILTVPILVFVFGYSPFLSAHYSLLIVGAVSAAGVVFHWSRGTIRLRNAIRFVVPAMMGMLLVKKFFLPSLPSVINIMGLFAMTLNQLVLVVFALFMILAAGSMICIKIKESPRETDQRGMGKAILLGSAGIGTGAVAGFVGAGGGFLIIPALVFLAGLPIKDASRVSLFIIALNSLWGFWVGTKDWALIPFYPLLLVISLALLGMILGFWIQERTQASRLKPAFGFFVLLMGMYVLLHSFV